jgi:hypothetical protein
MTGTVHGPMEPADLDEMDRRDDQQRRSLDSQTGQDQDDLCKAVPDVIQVAIQEGRKRVE